MGLLNNNLEKIQLIINQFETEREDTYEKNMASITAKLEKIIGELAEDNQLITKNNVRDIRHFRFSTRVKEVHSLHEKFVRGNLLPMFNDISIEKLKEENGEALSKTKQNLLEIDDIIGIKILTDLICDCQNVYTLIQSSDFKNKAQAHNIKLDEDDLKIQPVTMKNGLPIYKLKGKFEDKYNFELQIKSKLISAWGDMEHSIFYKDYAISPVRDTAQKSMNHVGKLLFDIDAFVESIRKADKDYADNAKALVFMDWMESNYSQTIRKKLGNISFNIGGISQILYSINQLIKIDKQSEIKPLEFDHFDLKVNDSKLKKYVKTRNDVFELQILEAISLSWLLKDGESISQENIEQVLNTYMRTIVDSTAQFLKIELSGKDFEEMQKIITELHEFGLSNKCNEKFLLDLKKMAKYLKESFILADYGESELGEDKLEMLKKSLFIFKNNGDLAAYISSVYEEDGFLKIQKIILSITEVLPKETKNETLKSVKKELEKINEFVKSKI